MSPKDLLDDMYEVLVAFRKTASFADLEDWNKELAEEVDKVLDRYREMKRINPHD